MNAWEFSSHQRIGATALIIVILVSVGVASFFAFNPDNPTPTTTPLIDNVNPEAIMFNAIMDMDNFSGYTDYEVEFEIDAPSYALEPGLANLINLDKFDGMQNWSEISQKIEENYFACIQGVKYYGVIPSRPYQQFSEIYDDNYWGGLPSFVSADAVYHIFHVLYDEALRTMETNNLTDYIETLSDHMIEVALAQYNAITDSWWQAQAIKNIAFFSVVKVLLNPNWAIPSLVSSMVNQVLELIQDAEGFNAEWFMHQLEDFSQYVPRGHYTRSVTLEQYFKALMWLGRINFRTLPSDPSLTLEENIERGRNETAQALLICQAMNQVSSVLRAEDVFRLWKSIYLPTAFFVGEADDVTPIEYNNLAQEIFGVNYTLYDLLDMELLDAFRNETVSLRNPRILSDFVVGGSDMENTTKGLAFMGQRYIPDSYMLGQLVFPHVGERLLPLGLDIFNVLGSSRAAELLVNETQCVGYSSQIEMLQTEFSALNRNNWTQNLYWSWLYALLPIINSYTSEYPIFMNTTAWNDKCLVTALGSWTELRHDTILYAKQSYTGYFTSSPPAVLGYVEPVPDVYARLASLCRMMLDGLESRYLLSIDIKNRLDSLFNLLLRLRDISIKELTSQELTEDEITTIGRIGSYLKYLEKGANEQVDRAALIADVHTDPNTQRVLEEATGDPMVIIVAVPTHNGSVYLARGGVYSYYEFAQPMDERLTDELWWDILDGGEGPIMPAWEHALIAVDNGVPVVMDQSMMVIVQQSSRDAD